jgi:histidinol-phosphatase (PHP family)
MAVPFDYHIHTPRCKHAIGTMEEYVRAGIKAGLSEMGFADHLPLPLEGPSRYNMALEEMPLYIADVLALRQKFPRIPIRLAVEADFIPGTETRLREILGHQELDYVIGSVHYLRLGPEQILKAPVSKLWGIDGPDDQAEWKSRDVDQVYREYYRVLRDAAGSRLFNVIGHADVPKKYGVLPTADLREEYKLTAEVFKSAGVLVELNTAGLRKPIREIYPGQAFLKALRAAGVGITFGSDSHKPDEVAFAWDKAMAWARQAGYEFIHGLAGSGRFEPFEIP